MNDNKRKLYNALSQDYDLGTFEQFESDIADAGKRRKLYDATIGEYDFGDYSAFENQLGFSPKGGANGYTFTASELDIPEDNTYQLGDASKMVDEMRSKAVDAGRLPVEGDIYKGESGYARTDIPLKTQEYSTLGEARGAANADNRKEALDAYRSAYNRLEQPGEVDEEALITWGNDMSKAPAEQMAVFREVMGRDAQNRVELDAAMRGIEGTTAELEGLVGSSARVLAKYLNMPEARREALGEDEKQRYEALLGAAKELDEKRAVEEMKTTIGAQLEEQKRKTDEYFKKHTRELDRKTGGLYSMRGGGIAAMPQYISSMAGTVGDKQWRTMNAIESLNSQSRGLIESSKDAKENTGLLGNVQNYFKEAVYGLADIENWLPVLTGMNFATVKGVIDKADEGKELTKDEEQLLEAIALNVATKQMYADDRTWVQDAGSMTGQMVPFMLEMAAGGMTAAGKGAMKGLAKWALKKFGKGASKSAKKAIYRTGAVTGLISGAVGGGYASALTVGAPRTTAEVIRRTTGEGLYNVNEDGKVEYAGHKEGEGVGEAIIKGTTKQMLEYGSEIAGAGYASLPFRWLQKTGKGTRLLGWMDNFANSDRGKLVQQFMERTGWHGPIEEFMEEIHVGLLDPDTPLDEFFTKKNLMSIALGVAVPGAVVSSFQTVGGIADGSFKTGAQEKWKMQRGALRAGEAWKERADEWHVLRNRLNNGNLDELDDVLTAVYEDPTLTDEQKLRALEYGVYSLQYRTAIGAREAMDEGRMSNIDAMLRDIYGEAFASDVSATAAKRSITALEEARANVQQMLGMPGANIEDIMGDRSIEEVSEGDKEIEMALTKYFAAKADFEGRQDRFADAIDSSRREVAKSIDRTKNDDGNVYSAALPTGETVYITGGKVVLDNEGYIDVNQSEGLVALMPDGSKKSVKPGDLREKFEVSNAEELKAAKREEIKQEVAAENGWKVLEPGVDIEIAFDGDVYKLKVEGRDERGDIILSGEGESMAIPESAVQEGIKEAERLKVKGENEVQPVIEGQKGENAEKAVEPVGNSDKLPDEAVQPAVAEVPDFFRMDGKNYSVVSRNEDGSVNVVVDGKRTVLPAGTDFSAIMPTDKGGNIQYTDMPIERTLEYFVQRVLNDKARAQMIENNRKQAEAALKKFDKEPNVGTDPDAYEATMNKWEADKKAAQAKVDYWNEVAKRDAEITRSETRDAVDNIAPEVVEQSAEEFIANQLSGVKITPESFKRETGLSNSEQSKLVGVISNDGVSVERAAEIIFENYDSELAGMGFTGDVQDIRDIIIDVLKSGNPRSYAKKGRELREKKSVDQQVEQAETWANNAFGMTLEELYLYEETLIPRIIRQYEGFDEQEYYNNLAENYENDTTRESESLGRGGELLQGEQSIPFTGAAVVGEGNEGGEIHNDVQGGSENGVAQEEVQSVGSSEIPNTSTGEVVSPVEVEAERGEKGQKAVEPTGEADNSTVSQVSDQVAESGRRRPKGFKRDEASKPSTQELFEAEKSKFTDIANNEYAEVLQSSANVDEAVAEFEHRAQEAEKRAEDWKNRKYKTNNSVVTGVNPNSGADEYSTTIGVANERRRDANVRNAQNAAKQYREFAKILKERTGYVAEGENTPGQSGAAEIKEPTFTEEVLENGDKRITKYNSRGEVEAVSTERDGKIISVDSYDDGVLFETTTYDGNGVSTSVTRYDKNGNVIAESKKPSPVSDLVQAVKEKSKQNRFNVYKAEKTKGAIRKRAEKFAKKLGIKVNVVESYDEVADEAAKAQILKGRTPGWFANGEAYIYMPHIINKADLDKTFVHEVVAHKGLRELMSKEEFNKFLDGAWSMMGDEARAKFLGYVGAVDENKKPLENPTQQQMREAADEYVAAIAEKVNYGNDLNAEEKNIWQKFIDFVKDIVAGKLNAGEVVADVLSKDAINEEDITRMILASYANMREGKKAEGVKEDSGMKMRIDNEVASVDGGTKFSKKGENKNSPNSAAPGKPVNATAKLDELFAKIDKLKQTYNSRTSKKTRGFITDIARDLNLTKDGPSHYGTFSTALGDVTLRVSNHNSKLKEFEDRYEDEGVSIIISAKKNKKIDRRDSTGKSHVDEFFYPKQSLERSQGRPLVQILESIEDFLTTGVYVDKTGIAQPEDSRGIRFRRVFHGSGAKFDKFDHSFMGTGEGNQAFGWGTYVTEVEEIGRTYAGVGVTKLGSLQAKLGNIDSAISSLEKEVQRAEKDLTSDNETARHIAAYTLETASERRKALEEEKAAVEEEIKPYRNLYTVEIPDDNGNNYLHWDKRIPMNVVNSIKKRLFDVLAEGDYKGAEKELKRELDDVFKADNNDGNFVYGNISAYLGGDKAASQFLNEMGFVGISYPADGGRAGNKRNYVIFNEDDAVIEDRTMFRRANENQEIFVSNARNNLSKNTNFANTYKTEDGKDINYTSERAEGYGVQGGGTGNSYDGTGNSILQRQTDTGVPGANSGLNEDKGEFCVVERVFTENGAFNFTSGEKIESADDVAYIFSALEDAAKEHSFVVYVKDGKPTVIELGMGSFNATMVDIPTASLAYSRINPDHVYFVHNHPSGNLVCSAQDVAMLRVFEDMSDVPVTGVIINLKTGKYGTFDTERHSVIGEKRVPENEERLTVHTLDKQIFAPDYDPMAQPLVRSSQDVAQFLNSQRMGDRPKVSFLILSRANRIIGNIHTPFTDITTDTEAVARYINERVIQFGGENAILYGDFAISMDESRGFRLLQGAMERFAKTKLLDVVHVEGNFTRSANDMGLLYEPETEYMEGQTMFRFIGKKGAENLDKAEEATTRLDNLDVAREMEAAGEDAKAIKLATGWERGADRLWRYETEDYTVNQDAQVYDPYNNMMRPFSDFFTRDGARGYIDADYSVRLDELINDDELFKAYPELEGFFVLVEDLGMGTNGAINFKEKIIKLNRNVVRLIPASIDDKVGYTVKVGSALAHEIQHAIQDIEGFASGGNADMQIPGTDTKLGESGYRRLAGEVEARNVQMRMDKTEEERRNSLAEETYMNDVALEEQIFIFDNLGMSASMGSRVDARMAEVAAHFDSKELPPEQRSVVDVYGGKADNLTISVKTQDGNERKVVMRQGNETGAGAKHSLYRHYRTGVGVITSDDIISIPDVVANGVRTEKQRGNTRLAEYKQTDANGNEFTVLTEIKKGKEIFNDFYSNKKALLSGTFNTQSAHTANNNALSADKGSNNSLNEQDPETRFRKAQETKREIEELDNETMETVKNLAVELNTPVAIVTDIDSIADERKRKAAKRGDKGWFDLKNGVVTIVMPNIADEQDAVETMMHEIVGHRGLRGLLGARYNKFLNEVYAYSPKDVRAQIVKRALEEMGKGTKNPMHVATEEYLAAVAERGFINEPTKWMQVVNIMKGFLRSMGVNVDINENEIAYMMWRSCQLLKSGYNLESNIMDSVMQQRMEAGAYRSRSTFLGPMRSQGRDLATKVELAHVRGTYERRVRESGFQAREALQDSMFALKEFQKLIEKATGKKLPDYFNAYYMENALSSANQAQAEAYGRLFYSRIVDAISELKNRVELDDIYDYLMIKHGIERNREMALKASLSNDEGALDKKMYNRYAEAKKKILEDADKNKTKWEEVQRELDSLAKSYGADLTVDYSGLSSIFKEKDFYEAAYKHVLTMDEQADFTELHKAIKNATDETLKKRNASGFMSKATMDEILDMYQYYVPLRGFEETTADEVYNYMTVNYSPIPSIKRARGRKSKAENPIAWIANAAEAAIVQGNRNMMKLAFYNGVAANPNDLVSIEGDIYIQKVNGQWVVQMPDIPANATAEEVEEIMTAHNERMKEMARTDKSVKRVTDSTDIPFTVVQNSELKEHQIFVRRNGKLRVMTVNGNPRLAQAINGMTNPNNSSVGMVKWFEESSQAINSGLSKLYTTANPDFILSNWIRDMIYSNSMVWVKESPAYAALFNKNCTLNAPGVFRLLLKYEDDKLNMEDPVERMFHEFMVNGGETGYTKLKDVEAQKKKLKKMLESNGVKDGAKAVETFIGQINRAVENAARFAAYRTSREMGRSITRSIYDAKEISVNFNKKGAGARFAGANGQTALGNTAAVVSGVGRGGYVFWNAGVQGMNNFFTALFPPLDENMSTKDYAVRYSKSMALIAVPLALGYLAASMGADDDEYQNLSPYVRRSNLCFKLFGNTMATIPLPIEYRAIYGTAEYLASVANGKEEFSAWPLAEQLSQLLPIDMLEGGGGAKAFIPSLAKPVYEGWTNTDWMGSPIAKQNDFNKLDPEYRRVYENVSAPMVGFSRMLNELGGGNRNRRASIPNEASHDAKTRDLWEWTFEWNPAILDNTLSGYAGGYYSFPSKVFKTAEMMFGDLEFDWKHVPFLNRVLKTSSEKAEEYRINEKYFDNLDVFEKDYHEFQGLMKDVEDVKFTEEERDETVSRINELISSGKAEDVKVLETYQSQVDELTRDYKKYGNDTLKVYTLQYKRLFNEKYNELYKEKVNE